MKSNEVVSPDKAANYLRLGKAHVVVRWAEARLRNNPHDLQSRELLARALWATGAHRALLDQLAILIDQNPYEPGYHALRGAVLEAQGFTGEAIKALSRARTTEAIERIELLESMQKEQIESLMELNPEARAAFRADLRRACETYGFAFAPPQESRRKDLSKRAVVRMSDWVRPS
ncbi:MAG: hypothetical protein JST35_09860 [Armatimonadetes bacterium]|nr:hypothetical protein [Armatimonadota bacterium]